MSKQFLWLAFLLMVIGLLVGCSSDTTPQDDASNETETEEEKQDATSEEESVVIIISKDDGEEVITEKEVTISEGDILMDVMEENFDIETDFDGGFVTSINGIAPEEGEQKGWLFYVNDEFPVVGAQELELSPGDQITFDFQAWE